MPKRSTIEEVKRYIDEHANGDCILLSTEYINSNTPLQLKCNLCGKEFQRDFQHIKRGRFCCNNCSVKNRAKQQAFTIDIVKQYIQKYDINNECILLSTEYINSRTPLQLKCNLCGKKFQRNFEHIKRGRFCCEECGERIGAKKLKYTAEDVENDIQQDGYHLIGKYINAKTGVLCQCNKGHPPFNLFYSEYKFRKRGCPECGKLKESGSNHWNWQGGISIISDLIRDAADDWKYELVKQYHYCDITGQTHNLEVHHLNINFADIVKESANNIGFIFNGKELKDYDIEKVQQLKKEIARLHQEKVKGVVLTKDLHRLFHSIYGKKNNTEEQYIEFKQKILNGEITL